MAVTGRQIKIGVKTASTWGTAVAVGTGNGQYLREDFRDDPQVGVSELIAAGQTFITQVQAGRLSAIRAGLPMYLHYSDVFQNLFWAHCLGTGGTAPSRVGTTTAYTNTFEPDIAGHSGLFATVVRDKVQKIVEMPSVKFNGFELTFGENGRAEITWNFVGMKAIENSAVNTATQIANLTFPPEGMRAFFEQCVVRLNAQSGGALASPGDVISGVANAAGGLTGLTVRFAQPMDEKYVGGVVGVVQPEDNGFPTCEIIMTFARFDAVSKLYTGYQTAQTALKMDITLTGGVIEGASNYGILLQFPKVHVFQAQDPIPASGEQSSPTVTMRAYAVTSAPTGMTGVLKPLRVTTTGSSSANPFA